MALMGLILIVFGGVSLARAQWEAAPQAIRVVSRTPYLGVSLEDVTAENMAGFRLAAEAGAIVRTVEKGSPAEAAHLQDNDVILEYAGMPVVSVAALTRMVQETPVGRSVNLGISRDGKKISLSARIGDRSAAGPRTRIEVLPGSPQSRQLEILPWGSRGFSYSFPGDSLRAFNFGGRGAVIRPSLGVTVESITEQLGENLGVPGKKGLLITSVTPGSPAAPVLKAGDVITSVDARPVSEPAQLTRALAGKQPGAKIELQVVRDKKVLSLQVELAKSKASSQGIRI